MNRQTIFNGVFESLRYDQCRGECGSFVVNCFFLYAIESRRIPTASFGEVMKVNSRIA